jgi:hypothetical protein
MTKDNTKISHMMGRENNVGMVDGNSNSTADKQQRGCEKGDNGWATRMKRVAEERQCWLSSISQ